MHQRLFGGLDLISILFSIDAAVEFWNEAVRLCGSIVSIHANLQLGSSRAGDEGRLGIWVPYTHKHLFSPFSPTPFSSYRLVLFDFVKF